MSTSATPTNGQGTTPEPPPVPEQAPIGTQANPRNLKWTNLAMMAFVVVWGFGNVVNNFANQGMAVMFSWVVILAIYFIPYALMVGEMGSTLPDARSGVTSWIRRTLGDNWAYLCGWTYWVVHVPYLAQKPQAVMIAFSWLTTGGKTLFKPLPTWGFQLIALAIFLLFMLLASRGIKSLNVIGSIAGMASFVMSILFILLMLGAPAIRGTQVATPNLTSIQTYLPTFDFAYFTTIAMLVFAVGGAEKISPYINNTKEPSKNFPRGMIALAVMVGISALLGSLAMGMMFDGSHMDAKTMADLKANGQYIAFQKLGQYWGVGNLFMYVQAAANLAAQGAALLISIDAPLKVLLSDADDRFIPRALRKENRFGAPVNGYLMTAVLVTVLILLPTIGIKDINELFSWLLDLNAVVMPMRYLWVFAAYIAIRRLAKKLQLDSEYKFSRHTGFAIGMGAWCFLFTAFACLLGMFPGKLAAFSPDWWFRVVLNFVTPVVLLGLGLILPMIARRTNRELIAEQDAGEAPRP